MLPRFRSGSGLFLRKHRNVDEPVGEIARGSHRAMEEKDSISAALRICLQGQRNVPVTSEGGERLVGMVTSRNVLDYLGAGSLHQIYRTRKHVMKTPVSRIMETGHATLGRGESLGDALLAFKRTGEEAIPLLRKGILDGMVTENDLVAQLSGKTGVRVWELMTSKPVVARNTHPVIDVARMLVRGGFSRLPVVRDTFVTGMVTPHDLLAYMNRNGKTHSLRRDRTQVEMAMNKMVQSIGPGEDISVAAGIMAGRRIAMLPVVEDYQILGVMTQRDIIDAM